MNKDIFIVANLSHFGGEVFKLVVSEEFPKEWGEVVLQSFLRIINGAVEGQPAPESIRAGGGDCAVDTLAVHREVDGKSLSYDSGGGGRKGKTTLLVVERNGHRLANSATHKEITKLLKQHLNKDVRLRELNNASNYTQANGIYRTKILSDWLETDVTPLLASSTPLPTSQSQPSLTDAPKQTNKRSELLGMGFKLMARHPRIVCVLAVVVVLIMMSSSGLPQRLGEKIFNSGGSVWSTADGPLDPNLVKWCKAFDIPTAKVDGTSGSLSEDEVQWALADKLQGIFLPSSPKPKGAVPKTDRDKQGNPQWLLLPKWLQKAVPNTDRDRLGSGKSELQRVQAILFVAVFNESTKSDELTKNEGLRKELEECIKTGTPDYLYQLRKEKKPLAALETLTGCGSSDAIVKFREAVYWGRRAKKAVSLSNSNSASQDHDLKSPFKLFGEQLVLQQDEAEYEHIRERSRVPFILTKDDLNDAENIANWLTALTRDDLDSKIANTETLQRLGHVKLPDSIKDELENRSQTNLDPHHAAHDIAEFVKALHGLCSFLSELKEEASK